LEVEADHGHVSYSHCRPFTRGDQTRPYVNRSPVSDRSPAAIREGDIGWDADIPFRMYESDWTLPPVKKQKRTTEVENAKSGFLPGHQRPVLNVDRKGHTKGTVQLGSRVRMRN
jgi:hypothetical protein